MSDSPSDQPSSAVPRPSDHPLKSIWLDPGPTIKQICATNPRRLYFPLAAVWGASYNLSLALRRGIPAETLEDSEISSPWVIVGINVFFGAVFGIVVLWLLSFLFAWLGRLLGGRGSARDVRTVLAWSSVPHIPNLVVAVLAVVIGGTSVLTAAHATGTSVSSHPLQVLFLLANGVFGIWGFVISVAGLQTVMGISALRAVGVLVFGGLLIFAVVFSSIIAVVKLASG